jgi:hypothetical protein
VAPDEEAENETISNPTEQSLRQFPTALRRFAKFDVAAPDREIARAAHRGEPRDKIEIGRSEKMPKLKKNVAALDIVIDGCGANTAD